MLASLADDQRQQLLNVLPLRDGHVDDAIFFKEYAEFLISRLARFASHVLAFRQDGFFSQPLTKDKIVQRRYKDIKSILSVSFGVDASTTEEIFQILGSRIDKMARRVCDDEVKVSMKEYLLKLKNPIGSLVPAAPVSVMSPA